DRALAGVDDAADDADKRRLARAVGAQQREYFAAVYIEVDVFQGLVSRRVRLGQALHGNDGLHTDLCLTLDVTFYWVVVRGSFRWRHYTVPPPPVRQGGVRYWVMDCGHRPAPPPGCHARGWRTRPAKGARSRRLLRRRAASARRSGRWPGRPSTTVRRTTRCRTPCARAASVPAPARPAGRSGQRSRRCRPPRPGTTATECAW